MIWEVLMLLLGIGAALYLVTQIILPAIIPTLRYNWLFKDQPLKEPVIPQPQQEHTASKNDLTEELDEVDNEAKEVLKKVDSINAKTQENLKTAQNLKQRAETIIPRREV